VSAKEKEELRIPEPRLFGINGDMSG